MKHTRLRQHGFTLPVVLLVSIGLMIVALSLVQSTSSISDSLNDLYISRLANEAAEAGITYANSCLNDNSFNQAWSSSSGKPLTQATDCTGTALGYSASAYIMSSSTARTSFSVNDLEVRNDGALIMSVIGKYEQLNASSSVIRTYTATRKQVVNWKIYQASKSFSGALRTCSIVTKEAYCWGTNNYGQLGNNSTTDSSTPVKVYQETGVLAGKQVDDLFAGQYHNCALAAGEVYCWGYNASYQLGDSTSNAYKQKPYKVQGALAGKTVTDIGGTDDTSCAIALGKIYCWGSVDSFADGRFDTTGTNSTSAVKTPKLVGTTNLDSVYGAGNYHAIALSTSGSYSQTMCAIINNVSSNDTDGDAWCWGNNEAGQVGNSSTTGVKIPTKVVNTGVLSGKTVIAISQDGATNGANGTATSNNSSHSCVVATDNKAYCWGENNSGQLGNASSTDSSVPVAVKATVSTDALYGKTVTDINAGTYHTCALASSKAYCWGYNGYGQLGTGNTTSSTVPKLVDQTVVGLSTTIDALGGGTNRGCFVANLKSYCWGLNNYGQIGDGTTTNRNLPTESIYLRPKVPSYVF